MCKLVGLHDAGEDVEVGQFGFGVLQILLLLADYITADRAQKVSDPQHCPVVLEWQATNEVLRKEKVRAEEGKTIRTGP